MQVNSTEQSSVKFAQTEFARLFGIDQPVSEKALHCALRNEEYFHNLVVSRKNSMFFQYLLDNPPSFEGTPPEDSEVREFLDNWQKRIDNQKRKDAYRQKYKAYFNQQEVSGQEEGCCQPVSVSVDDFREVYLDYNATTPIRAEVLTLLEEYYTGLYGFGNPSSDNPQGYAAADMVSGARSQIAACLGVKPSSVYFTGSGSEANNLAIKGIAFQHWQEKGHIITTKAEHKSVLAAMEYLESLGFSVTYLDVDDYGMVSSDCVRTAIRDNTILVSIMAANNEIGTLNPLRELGALCKEKGIPFMTDAIQAFGKIPLHPNEMNLSIITISGHKIYAPKGVGALYIREGLMLTPLVHGGGQESGLHAGTENVGHIAAFGLAARLACDEMEEQADRWIRLRHYFLTKLKVIEPEYRLNGHPERRLPNNLSISFPGVDSRALMQSLGQIGISVSASSACSAKRSQNSHVMEAIRADTAHYATIRFGMGYKTTIGDLDYLFGYLEEILKKLKNQGRTRSAAQNAELLR